MSDNYATKVLSTELGYVFHTAFRKALPNDGHEVWVAIKNLAKEDPEAWGFVLEYVADHLLEVFPAFASDPGLQKNG